MSAPAYSAAVVEHFEGPRNVGRFAAAPDVIEASAGGISRGAQFTLSARIRENRVVALRYEVYGCPHCIAAGSWLTERLTGATLEQLRSWSWREAAQALQVPADKSGRLLLLEDAVRALAAALQARTRGAEQGESGAGHR